VATEVNAVVRIMRYEVVVIGTKRIYLGGIANPIGPCSMTRQCPAYSQSRLIVDCVEYLNNGCRFDLT